MLFGEDRNRNGVLDPNENDGDLSDPPDNMDGTLDRGFYDYVTVYSREENTDAEGEERVAVNRAQSPQLSQLLNEAFGAQKAFQVMDQVRLHGPFDSLVAFFLRSGLSSEEFQKIEDRITTENAPVLIGRVNVNTASWQVLSCLPMLDEQDAKALVEKRTVMQSGAQSIVWITEVLTTEKAIAAGPHLTVRSSRMGADIVAAEAGSGGYARYRVVLEAVEDQVVTLYWKPLSHLGWPLSVDMLEALKSGRML
jgi:DNA uptake protein ComE-like DNA-binding protein